MAEREEVTAEALGVLYAEYRVSLTATAQRALLARGVPESVVSAEDIVQNAFAKALRNPASIEKPIGYLRTVIRTEVANRARQQAEHSRLEARRTADPLRFDPVVQSADFTALIANRCAVEQALAGLSLPQRTAVWATKALDCTQDEAAALMDRAPGTVATHVSRGMVLLRASLVAAVVAAIVCVAGGFIGSTLERTDPAREPGEGAGTSPARWWHDGWAMLAVLYERWPAVALPLLMAACLVACLAACAVVRWVWQRCLTGISGTPLGRWLSLRRTMRAWSRATSRLGVPFAARDVTPDVIVFTVPDDADLAAVSKGMEGVSRLLEGELGRVVRLELSDGPTRRRSSTPNTRLQDLLGLAGWSKGELARLVNRQAAAMGHPQPATDTSRVRRWIDSGEIPRDPVPRVLAALFTERLGRVVTAEDLGLVRHGHTGRRSAREGLGNADELPWAPERTAVVLTEFTGTDLMLNRRGAVGAGAALAAGTAVRGSALPPDRPATQAPLKVREALKIIEVVARAPQGASRAQIARSLRTFGTAEAAVLSMLIREGYLHQLPDNRYTIGRELRRLAVDQDTGGRLLLPASRPRAGR